MNKLLKRLAVVGRSVRSWHPASRVLVVWALLVVGFLVFGGPNCGSDPYCTEETSSYGAAFIWLILALGWVVYLFGWIIWIFDRRATRAAAATRARRGGKGAGKATDGGQR